MNIKINQENSPIYDLMLSYSELVTQLVSSSFYMKKGSDLIHGEFAIFGLETLKAENLEKLESLNNELKFLIDQMYIVHEYFGKVLDTFNNQMHRFMENLRFSTIEGKIHLEKIICSNDFGNANYEQFEERQQKLRDLFKQRELEFNLPFEK